jgi:hypothetical protein
MFTTTSMIRTVVLGVALASLTASSAVAQSQDLRSPDAAESAVQRPQDLRSPDAAAAEGTQQRPAPARMEGMGVQPVRTPAASEPASAPTSQASAASLTTATDSSGIDWLAVVIGGCAVLAVGLAAAAMRSYRHRSHTPLGNP